MKLTGAQALIKSLEMQGVEVMFGLPGGAILPVYDPIIDSSIRHILVRHEQGAGHMAEGYAMVTGRPGVAMVTSGPGATNIVTPLSNAYMDSTPLVVIIGPGGDRRHRHRRLPGVRHHRRHHGHHQAQLARHGRRRTSPGWWPRPSTSPPPGGPGPVLIDLPKDVSNATMEWYWPSSVDELDLPGYHPVTVGDPVLVAPGGRADRSRRERPVLYVGRRACSSPAAPRRCGSWPSAPASRSSPR